MLPEEMAIPGERSSATTRTWLDWRRLRGAACTSLAPTLLAGLLLHAAVAMAQTTRGDAADRGQLLYETHCIQCHTEQMHWRERRIARDWPSLRAQVEAWQTRAGQIWPAEDVDAVARYLNGAFYHYPLTRDRAVVGSGRMGAAPQAVSDSSDSR